MAAPSSSGPTHQDFIDPDTIPFVLFHPSCLWVVWSGMSSEAIATGSALHAVHRHHDRRSDTEDGVHSPRPREILKDGAT